MDFAIPDELPVQDTDIVVDSDRGKAEAEATMRLREQQASSATVTADEARAFMEAHDLVPLLNELLSDVILAAEEDPIDHMTRWFLRHAPASQAERDEVDDEEGAKAALEASEQRNATVAKQHDAAVDYCRRYCLPQLIDELLAALIAEKPEDQGRFAMSWLRWHKKRFIMRYKPEGYAAFIEAENTDRDRSPAAATSTEEPPAAAADEPTQA